MINTVMSQNNNWNNIRGKKVKKNNEKKNIDFEKFERKILYVVNEELTPLCKENYNTLKKYFFWIIN